MVASRPIKILANFYREIYDMGKKKVFFFYITVLTSLLISKSGLEKWFSGMMSDWCICNALQPETCGPILIEFGL